MMTKSHASPTSSSSSSDQTDRESKSAIHATLDLGKQLAAELDEWDVLGRWMAHHVAELITAAEATDGETDSTAARSRAAQEILLLWSHRTSLPRPYPLESFDHIFVALDRLENPSASGRLRRYFGNDAPTGPELAVAPLLTVAARVDEDARDVVARLIAEAVIEAQDVEARWMPIAMEIAEEQNAPALRRLMSATRRLRTGAGMQESHPGDDLRGAAASADEVPADHSTRGESDEESTDARQAELLEAIDEAIATLSQLRSALTDQES